MKKYELLVLLGLLGGVVHGDQGSVKTDFGQAKAQKGRAIGEKEVSSNYIFQDFLADVAGGPWVEIGKAKNHEIREIRKKIIEGKVDMFLGANWERTGLLSFYRDDIGAIKTLTIDGMGKKIYCAKFKDGSFKGFFKKGGKMLPFDETKLPLADRYLWHSGCAVCSLFSTGTRVALIRGPRIDLQGRHIYSFERLTPKGVRQEFDVEAHLDEQTKQIKARELSKSEVVNLGLDEARSALHEAKP